MMALPYQLDAAQARHDAERPIVLNRSLRRQQVRHRRRLIEVALVMYALGSGSVLLIEDIEQRAHGKVGR